MAAVSVTVTAADVEVYSLWFGVCVGGPDVGGFPSGRGTRLDLKPGLTVPVLRGGPPDCGGTGQNHNELLKPLKTLISLNVSESESRQIEGIKS